MRTHEGVSNRLLFIALRESALHVIDILLRLFDGSSRSLELAFDDAVMG